ncbi:TPA: DUF551 domain-containing protein [Klebsiella pneumoniae]|nr:DUF551 domain-containing protein [Klebsiella pneumoniae]HBW7650905.1 DUF551 domain-containing protein [Klebsiella pneumoniae]HBW7689223.1 DUF551 domain-containing protein [Klebsiella pneumoniae]
MTSKLTRERLEQLADNNTICKVSWDERIELAKIALAAMGSEPVAIIDQANLDYLRSGADADVWPPEREEMGDVLLYRHTQPAPVVPELRLDWQENEFSAGWNACRAAMLEADPQLPGSDSAPVPGSWIPVSERMPPPRYEVLVGRWWGEKPRWCCKWATYIPGHPDAQSSGWLIPGASWTPTHWMPLPAAPQEVNRE